MDNDYFGKGNTFFAHKKFLVAIEFYNKAVNSKSLEWSPSSVWYNKGLAHKSINQFEEAIKCFDKVMELLSYSDVLYKPCEEYKRELEQLLDHETKNERQKRYAIIDNMKIGDKWIDLTDPCVISPFITIKFRKLIGDTDEKIEVAVFVKDEKVMDIRNNFSSFVTTLRRLSKFPELEKFNPVTMDERVSEYWTSFELFQDQEENYKMRGIYREAHYGTFGVYPNERVNETHDYYLICNQFKKWYESEYDHTQMLCKIEIPLLEKLAILGDKLAIKKLPEKFNTPNKTIWNQ